VHETPCKVGLAPVLWAPAVRLWCLVWRTAETVFAHPRLRTAADFVEGPVEYLGHGRAYDYAG